jgi:hypothetical protein
MPPMRTPRLPVVDWTDPPPADLNGLVRCAEIRNLVSARVPSHFKSSIPLQRPTSWQFVGCLLAAPYGSQQYTACVKNCVMKPEFCVQWTLCVKVLNLFLRHSAKRPVMEIDEGWVSIELTLNREYKQQVNTRNVEIQSSNSCVCCWT